MTAKAGVGASDFSTSAAWLDYDKDGWLDLFIVNYLQWSIEKDLFCALDGKNKSYCTPEAYKGASPRLFRSKGDGTFTDVTKAAGMLDPTSKALGIALLDYNADGWLDLFAANDTQPNRLYRNTGQGTFVDEAVAAGVAFNDAGVPRAGMGTDAADYDGSGRPSLVVGNFTNEMIALYHNEGSNLFFDEAPGGDDRPRLAADPHLRLLLLRRRSRWACSTSLRPMATSPTTSAGYSRRSRTPRRRISSCNLGGGKFESIGPRAGAALQKPTVARGAAYGDYDGDGDLDLVLTANNGPARLLRNEGGRANRWLRVQLRGTKSNRSGIGATVVAALANGRKRAAMVKTGSSYLSQSELPLTFGLGADGRVTALEVRWPSGQVDRTGPLEHNRTVTIVEGKGVAK